jgi:hypothetical protein
MHCIISAVDHLFLFVVYLTMLLIAQTVAFNNRTINELGKTRKEAMVG